MKPQARLFAVLISVNLCLFFFASGCDRINSVDPQQIQAIAKDVNDLVAKSDAYQEVAAMAIRAMVATGAMDPNKGAIVIAEGNAAFDELQLAVRQFTAGVQSADYADNTTGLLTLIEAAQAANAATATWNPYSAVIAAALTILSMVLGLALKKKTAALATTALKYQAHKQAAERTMKLASVSDVAEVKKFEQVLYDSIGSARSALGVT